MYKSNLCSIWRKTGQIYEEVGYSETSCKVCKPHHRPIAENTTHSDASLGHGRNQKCVVSGEEVGSEDDDKHQTDWEHKTAKKSLQARVSG